MRRLEPRLSFGHVRKRPRAFAGLSPCFPLADGAGDEPVAGDNPDGLLVLIGRRFTAGELIRSLNAFGIDDVTAREAAVVQANVPSHSDHDVATVHVQRAAIK